MTDPLPSRAQNLKDGKGLRIRVPREAHAELHGPLDRDAVAILAESDASRVPELLPERYKRMTENAFRISPRRGGGDGERSRASANRRRSGAGLRRLSFDEFWRVQHARRQHPL